MIHRAKNENAVSPIIGTILLVALTVVLVAIIAAVVMGMSGNVGNAKNVGLIVGFSGIPTNTPPGGTVDLLSVTIISGKDVQNLRALNVSVEGATYVTYRGNGNMEDPANSGMNGILTPINLSDIVGLPIYYMIYPFAGPSVTGQTTGAYQVYDNVLVTVTGTFSDGTQVVLYKNRMPIPPQSYNIAVPPESSLQERPQSPIIVW